MATLSDADDIAKPVYQAAITRVLAPPAQMHEQVPVLLFPGMAGFDTFYCNRVRHLLDSITESSDCQGEKPTNLAELFL